MPHPVHYSSATSHARCNEMPSVNAVPLSCHRCRNLFVTAFVTMRKNDWSLQARCRVASQGNVEAIDGSSVTLFLGYISFMLRTSLFSSKIGFSRILDSLWSSRWRCSRVRTTSPKVNWFGWNLWSTLSTLSGAGAGRFWARSTH